MFRAVCGAMPDFMAPDIGLTMRTLLGDFGGLMCGWIRQSLSSEPLVTMIPVDARTQFVRCVVEYTEAALAAGKKQQTAILITRQEFKRQIKLLADVV